MRGRPAKVVVTDYTFPDLDSERQVAAKHGADFTAHQCRSAEEVAEVLAGADVVLAQFAPVTRPAIAGLANDAVIVRYGVGFDNIDLTAVRETGVRVAYVPDYCVDEVADHTAASLLCLLRKLSALDRSVRDGQWQAVATCRPLPPFERTLVGFVGLGRIGRAVMARLQAFRFRFAVHDPHTSADDVAQVGAIQMTLPELLGTSDAVLLHAPSTPSTRHLINRETLSAMKRSAVLVNTARGDLIDDGALADALTAGKLAGVALDVFEEEPLPPDSPLRTAPNVMLGPHAAWYSDSSITRLQQLAAAEVDRALSGEPLRCPVPV